MGICICYFASYNSSLRGVGILFNNFDMSVKKKSTKSTKDTAGNDIFASVRMMDKDFLLQSVYTILTVMMLSFISI